MINLIKAITSITIQLPLLDIYHYLIYPAVHTSTSIIWLSLNQTPTTHPPHAPTCWHTYIIYTHMHATPTQIPCSTRTVLRSNCNPASATRASTTSTTVCRIHRSCGRTASCREWRPHVCKMDIACIASGDSMLSEWCIGVNALYRAYWVHRISSNGVHCNKYRGSTWYTVSKIFRCSYLEGANESGIDFLCATRHQHKILFLRPGELCRRILFAYRSSHASASAK